MIELVKSGVIFNSDPHSYTLDGKELKGITGILSKHIFTNKYFNVDEDVLTRAKERGTLVHEQCRSYDRNGFVVSDEQAAYANIKDEYGLTTIANEYTVSDNVYVASNIDAVHHYEADEDNEVVLTDFKTTAHLDVEYLSWQLSIYKYLFEMQNPHLKVKRLLAVWLPLSKYGKPRAEVIPMKDEGEVKRLLDCDARGVMYEELPTEIPSEVLQIRERCFDVFSRMAELKKESDALHEALYKAMEANDIKKWETDKFTCTRTLPTTSKRFDSKRFKEDNPDMYDMYVSESNVKGSVKITLKKNKQ